MITMLADAYINAFDGVFEAIFGTNPMTENGTAILIGILIGCFVMYAGAEFILTIIRQANEDECEDC